MNTQPVSPEDLHRYYNLGWERRWLSRLNALGVPGDAGYKLRLKRTMNFVRSPRRGPFRILDAGCGVGIYAVHLARRFPQASVLGVDLSPVQIEAATGLAIQFHVSDRVSFRVGDLTSPSLETEFEKGWDVILLAEILEHLLDPAPTLKRLGNLLAPGGQMIISVPQWTPEDPGAPWIQHRVLTGGPNMENVESRDPASLPIGEMYTYYHRHYRPVEMQTLLADAGLEVQRHEAVFWQRSIRLQGVLWRACDYLLRRTAWSWLDRVLQATGGTEWAHNLLWDCCVPGKL